MKKKLSRSGSGWALFMPKTLLELINVNPETDFLEVSVENDLIKIRKAKEVGRLGIPAQQLKNFSFHLTIFLKQQVKSHQISHFI